MRAPVPAVDRQFVAGEPPDDLGVDAANLRIIEQTARDPD